MSTGFYGTVRAIWGSSSNDVWAVGLGGYILHWNGAFWASVTSGTNWTIQALWGADPDDLWGVGSSFQSDGYSYSSFFRWNGTYWTSEPADLHTWLYDIWGSGPNDIWAVGGSTGSPTDIFNGAKGAILHWDGASWSSALDVSSPWLYGIWGFGPNDIWAVGAAGYILHWNGLRWAAVSDGLADSLGDIWGSGPDDIWAAGMSRIYSFYDHRDNYYGTLLHWDGASWSVVLGGETIKNHFTGLWGSGPNDVWVIGDKVLHWNGVEWTSFEKTMYGLKSIWGSDSANVWVGGSFGVLHHWDGTQWSDSSDITDSYLNAVWGTDSGNIWAAGEQGTILRWRSLPAHSTHSLSGTVSGTTNSAVSIVLTGSANRATTTDSSGCFRITSVLPGSYTVTPFLSGYAFSPASTQVTLGSSNITDLQFTATSVGLNIEGLVLGADAVTLSTSGTSSASCVSDSSGSFRLQGLPPGDYTVTPRKPGFTFEPLSATTRLSRSDASGLRFQAFANTSATYAISGSITGTVSVTVTLTGDRSGTLNTTSSGDYAIEGLPHGEYVVTPSKPGFVFEPISRAMRLSNGGAAHIDFKARPNAERSYKLSGTVTSDSLIPNVVMALSGERTGSTLTDARGKFSFDGLSPGDYVLTPSRGTCLFEPVSTAVKISAADATDLSFMGHVDTKSALGISGKIDGAPRVTVTLSGSRHGSTLSDSSGNFSFIGLPSGSYVVTPERTGYLFEPVSTAVALSTLDVTNLDYRATADSSTLHRLSGLIVGASAVQITLDGPHRGTTVSDPSGRFHFDGLPPGEYTITPSALGFGFEPTQWRAAVLDSDLVSSTFVAVTSGRSISGTVAGSVRAGVTIALSGAATRQTVTDDSGNYQFSGLIDGAYTLTATQPGVVFEPPTRAAVLSGGDLTGRNFMATQTCLRRWCRESPPPSYRLNSVWGSGPNDVWMVGIQKYGGPGIILHWDGTDWTSTLNDMIPEFYGIWGSASNDVWAVGANGALLHWNGMEWSSSNSGATATSMCIAGESSNDIWLSPSSHWNGSAWSTTDGLNLLCAWSSRNGVWAIDSSRRVQRWDGQTWSAITDAVNPTIVTSVNGIWGFGPSDVWGVGHWRNPYRHHESLLHGVIFHWNGESWSYDTMKDGQLFSIWGSSPSDIWAAGYSSNDGNIFHWNGFSWVATNPGSVFEMIYSVWGSGPDDVWAVGYGGVVLHWRRTPESADSSLVSTQERASSVPLPRQR